jgi:hypothetical protein
MPNASKIIAWRNKAATFDEKESHGGSVNGLSSWGLFRETKKQIAEGSHSGPTLRVVSRRDRVRILLNMHYVAENLN